jgi:probable HAF family extracellular repeat protein
MRQKNCWKLFAATVVGLIGLADPAAAQVAPSYTLTDLGTLAGGTNSRAYGINASNEVVGYSEIAGGARRATAWVGGVANNLGVLAGDGASEARGVNAAGTIVGFSSDATPGTADKAVTFTIGGSPTNLNVIAGVTQPTSGPVLTQSRAEGISPTGEIVGHVYSAGSFDNTASFPAGVRGFYRSALGTVTRLDPTTITTFYPNDAALSYGINATGQVFGQTDDGTGAQAAFRGSRWSLPTGAASTPSAIYPTASGSPTLTQYLGFKGNNVSRMVGSATDIAGANSQAFASDGTTTTLLTNLGTGIIGIANAINNNALTNVIVGGTDTVGGGAEHATAWNWSATPGALPSAAPIDLNTRLASNPTGMVLEEALDINDTGFIVGFGLVGGVEHAFLLSPVAVPEPGTLALCGFGLGGLALRTWRRRRQA